MTKRLSPDFLRIEDWRGVVANNARINHVVFEIETDETWLPTVMRDAGFFPSNSEVKKNRSDLWRDLVPGETVKLSWARITIVRSELPCLHCNGGQDRSGLPCRFCGGTGTGSNGDADHQ